LVRPTTPLGVGAKVGTEVPACPSKPGVSVALSTTVTPVAPEPVALGTLSAGPARASTTGELGCVESDVGRAVDLELAPDLSLRPYLPITVFDLIVDGKPWIDPIRDLPSIGSFKTTLAARCEGTLGLTAGPHDLEVRAWIGDRSTPLSTAKVRVDLSCPTAADPDADASMGCSTGSGSKGAWIVLASAMLALRRTRRR